MYATGIGNAVEPDQGAVPPLPNALTQALIYHTFAALGGNIRSEMTVAYRHLVGIGTPQSCEDAIHYYKSVADKCSPQLPLVNPSNRLLPFWTSRGSISATK
jgi:SEL1 protein